MTSENLAPQLVAPESEIFQKYPVLRLVVHKVSSVPDVVQAVPKFETPDTLRPQLALRYHEFRWYLFE